MPFMFFMVKFSYSLSHPRSVSVILLILLVLACARVRINLAPTPTPTLAPPPTASPTPLPTPLPTVTPFIVTQVRVTPELGCLAPDLAVGAHISAGGSYTETQTMAAGAMVCRIERDSCAYQHLVGILDPTIVFKKEELSPFDTEDIVMHPAMLAPLSRLSRLVLAEWDDAFQLRVTDAYDSLLEHDLNQLDTGRKSSLHFEGRAIDLTTWPVDRSRYGRLCTLALCAGFDWVHNEETHCHAALSAESVCTRCEE